MGNSATAKAMTEGGLNASASPSHPSSQKLVFGASKAGTTSQTTGDTKTSKEGRMMSIKDREAHMAQEKEEAGYQTFLFSLF